MRVISKKMLKEYWAVNAQSETALVEWYYKIKTCNAQSVSDLRNYFNSVDPVHGYTVFNIGGNNYRLITAIHYNTGYCYIRAIWTHAEYSKKTNQEKLRRREL